MQTPLVHVSVALQHGTPVEQLRLVAAHAAAAAWQVPCVAPSGMLQDEPAQQSPSTVQLAPDAWQEPPPVVPVPPVPPVQSPHLPPVQVPLQQSVAWFACVQVPPVSLHVGDDVGRRQANQLSP